MSYSAGTQSYEDFVKVHGVLLAASGLRVALHRKLFQKLAADTLDGGNYFQVEPVEDLRQRRLVLTAESMRKDSDVFLVDHAWTFRLSDAYIQLKEVPGLAERMGALMSVDADLNADAGETEDDLDTKLTADQIVEREFCKIKEEGNHSVRWLELEELEIDDAKLVSLDLPTKFPHLLALSLCNNKLQNPETVVCVVTQFKYLRALWLNHNPILESGDNYLEDAILKKWPQLEIFNSCFISNYGNWALGFCGGLYEKDNPGNSHETDNSIKSITYLDLSNKGICNLITKAFCPTEMPILSHLNLRGNPYDEN